MKKNILLSMCILLSFLCHAQQHYYWADNKKNALEPDSTIVVLMKQNVGVGRSITSLADDKVERYDGCAVFRNTTSDHRKKLKDKKIEFATAFRVNSVPLIVTNVISFRPKASINEIERFFKSRIRFRDRTASGVYHYIVHNFRETLAVANALAESGLVEWCQPDFVIEIKTTSLDPLYNQQYYLNNTGQTGGLSNIDINAPEAWGISKGCYPTRVAVLDFGVEPHEDLGARYQTGFTALNPAGTGLPASTEYHGQACAGIIAASHDNNLGIAGVSPTSLIIPVNGFLEINNVSAAADAIDAGWRPTRGNADVLSNSWTWANAPSLSEITDAINNARTLGRNLKGTIVVFSAGNLGGSVEFPANVEGVITVGAINKSGSKWGFSATGSSLDLMAPTGNGESAGDVYTLDLSDDPGNNGDNRGGANGNYLSTFGGTSAAAPQAAGVAALMLSVNPELTEAQVRSFLQQSATDMGTAGFDNSYGYGRLNAFEALKRSIGSISGPDLVCSPSQYTLNQIVQGITNLTWSSSNPSGLSIHPTTGSVTPQSNFKGQVTITATITTPCGTLYYPKTVMVGKPFAYTTAPDPTICTQVFVQPTPYTLPVSPGADSYSLISNSSNLYVENPGGPGIEVIMITNQVGTYTMTLTTTNGCGSSQANIYVYAQSCGGGGGWESFVVSPNPAKDFLDIQASENTLKNTATPSSLQKNTNGNTLKVTFFTEQTMTPVLETQLKRQGGKINLAGVPKGSYILQISDGHTVDRGHILIE